LNPGLHNDKPTFRRSTYGTAQVVFGVLVVSVLAIGFEVRGFKPGRDDGFLRAIKSTARLSSEGK
jgi:hypothetical protein